MTERTRPTRGAKNTYVCLRCNILFTARVADRKRGWARFCSKSCKAIRQEQRTGQYANYLNRESEEPSFSNAHLFSNEE